jgi:hypothetical protein
VHHGGPAGVEVMQAQRHVQCHLAPQPPPRQCAGLPPQHAVQVAGCDRQGSISSGFVEMGQGGGWE